MATLATGTNRLQDINRRRDLAAVLQKQAMSFQPIQHPFQGLAKLAQALAANAINRRSTEDEKALEEERRKAFIEALSPATENIQGPGSQYDIGIDEPEMLSIPGYRAQISRAKTPAEILQGLPTDLSEQVAGTVVQQSLLAQMGLLPGQLKGTKPPNLQGDAKEVNLGDGNWFPAEVFTNPDPNQPGFFMMRGGQKIPLDSQQIRDPLERTTTVPFSATAEISDVVSNGMVAISQINRLEGLIRGGGQSADENTIGAARNWAESVRSAFIAIGETADVVFRGKVMRDQGQLQSRDAFSSYTLSDMTEQDKQKYSQTEAQANLSAWEQLQSLDARTQQLSISIAYTMARIADPGGRLSEMDVLNQIRSLGLQSPSKVRRLSALFEAKKTFAYTMQSKIRLARMNNVKFNAPPEFEEELRQIERMTAPDFGSNVNPVDYIRNLSEAEKRAIEIEKGLAPGSLDNL